MKLKVLHAALLFMLFQQPMHAADAIKPLKSADIAPEFKLNDYRGAAWSWQDVSDKPVVVVAFLGTQCPLVRAYAERLQQLADEYAGKNVAFVGINANQ